MTLTYKNRSALEDEKVTKSKVVGSEKNHHLLIFNGANPAGMRCV